MSEKQVWPVRSEFFFGTGFVFVSPPVWPELAEIGVVQRFASDTTEHVHEVRFADGLECSCPGWRTHGKCWHMRFVLRYNVGAKWSVGTFVRGLPTSLEWPNLAEYASRKAWLADNIAVIRRGDVDARARDARDLAGLNGPAPSREHALGARSTSEVHRDVAGVKIANGNGDGVERFVAANGTNVDEHAFSEPRGYLTLNGGTAGTALSFPYCTRGRCFLEAISR